MFSNIVIRITTITNRIQMERHRDAWLAQPVKQWTSAQVTISQFTSSSPASGSVLAVQTLEPASDAVCSSLSAPSLCSLSLSKINKHLKKLNGKESCNVVSKKLQFVLSDLIFWNIPQPFLAHKRPDTWPLCVLHTLPVHDIKHFCTFAVLKIVKVFF